MKYGIIFQDGYRKGVEAVMRHAQGVAIIYGGTYRLKPTGERTLPEGYKICDVFSTDILFEGDDGHVLWQIAVPDSFLAHLS